ncbi:MAG TPA: hypothetical protein DCG75_18190 [Bacteroidales bacterium]|jgi:hypothetical protein|nr:hypothetical protein [Bacteroidales bacterium]
MKYKTHLLFFCFSSLLFLSVRAQEVDLKLLLTKPDVKNNCEIVSSNVEIKINQIYKNDSINQLIDLWEKSCGETEPLMRLKIIDHIKSKLNTDSLISFYFRNYSDILFNRISDSKELDYNKIYFENKEYYSYIPLHGYFDNFILELAENFIAEGNISKNEELICTLFSFDNEQYLKKVNKKEYKETEIAKINYERLLYNSEPFTYSLMLGSWIPINDTKNIFGIIPQLGVGFGIRGNKLEVGIGMHVRININDNDFEIKAKSDTISTNSDIGILIGANVSYKLYTKNKWQIHPNLGIGWDIIETDVVKDDTNEEETIYYDLSAINLSVGFTVLYEVLINKYIGIGANYHFVPYNTDNNYYTRLSSDYLTLNLIYKF